MGMGGPAIVLLTGTNLLLVIPSGTPELARVDERGLRYPRVQIPGHHAHSWPSLGSARSVGKRLGNVRDPPLSVRVRSGDLVLRGPPQRFDERGPPCPVTQRRADGFRNGIRCFDEWT
jgi:hypothetical protein